MPRFQPLSEEEIDAINLGGAGLEDGHASERGASSYVWAMELTMKPRPVAKPSPSTSQRESSQGGRGGDGDKKKRENKMTQQS